MGVENLINFDDLSTLKFSPLSIVVLGIVRFHKLRIGGVAGVGQSTRHLKPRKKIKKKTHENFPWVFGFELHRKMVFRWLEPDAYFNRSIL